MLFPCREEPIGHGCSILPNQHMRNGPYSPGVGQGEHRVMDVCSTAAAGGKVGMKERVFEPYEADHPCTRWVKRCRVRCGSEAQPRARRMGVFWCRGFVDVVRVVRPPQQMGMGTFTLCLPPQLFPHLRSRQLGRVRIRRPSHRQSDLCDI